MAEKDQDEVKATEVVVANQSQVVPSFMEDDFGGSGFEGADKDSFAIPFLQVIQKMSPMADEDSPKYITGAKAGMLFNTVSQRLYDGKAGLLIIPCAFKRSFIQWAGRDAEGGFKGEFMPEQVLEMQNRGDITSVGGRLMKPLADGSVNEKKSDYFADTRSHFVLIIDPETGEISRAIMPLSASQVKASKMLMTALQQKKVETPRGRMTPPTFANLVRVTTSGMSNEKGSWSGVNFALEGMVTDPAIYAEAKDFYKAINAGEVNVDHSKSDHQTNDVGDKPTEADGF